MQIARKNYDLQLIVRGNRETEPQINADERRFVNLDIQHLSEVYQGNSLLKSPQSTQRSQSLAIHATAYESAPPTQRGTRMTQIVKIFTDLRESASSVTSIFYTNPSAFICVHLRLIFVSLSDIIQKIQIKLFPIINENGFVPVTNGILRRGK